MTLYCIDKTAGELCLLPDVLQMLRRQSDVLKLYTENSYHTLLSFFTPDSVERALPESTAAGLRVYVIARMADLDAVPAGALCFPIIPQSEAEQYEAAAKGAAASCIPMAEQSTIAGYAYGDVVSLQDMIARRQTAPLLQGVRVLISAGPTAEDLDPVRYLTNRSTGKMGLALARTAFIMGADVRLVMGATALSVPRYLSVTHVRSAAQMAEAIFKSFPDCHVYVGAAAIADFTPAATAEDKIKKRPGALEIALHRTVDVIGELGRRKKEQFIVGFSVETSDEIKNSIKKMKTKKLDMIVVNNPKQAGAAFAADTNQVTILYADESKEDLPLMSKEEVGALLWKRISQRLTVKK